MWFIIFLCLMSIGYTGAHERPFVVVIPSYNNAEWYQKNLDSVFMQQYENYRVIYIDDYSPDGTGDLVKRYVLGCEQDGRTTVIKNNERCGALANHYKAVHMCGDYEIIIQLDGDDWFAREDVLTRINEEYENQNVWLTYGQYEIYPTDEVGRCRVMPEVVITYHAYREYDWISSAPRTFYAWLFKQIRLQDLLCDGDFFAAGGDLAFMYPMLEMAAGKIKFIDEVLYIYNCETPNNDFKKRLIMQLHAEYVVRSREKYTPLDQKLPVSSNVPRADLIIFSEDNPLQLYLLIESIYANVSDFGTITVLYRATTKKYYEAYKRCTATFSKVSFQQFSDSSFRKNFIELVRDSNDYILFARDNFMVIDRISIVSCIELMRQTQAYGFFLALGKNIVWSDMFVQAQKQPYLIELNNDCCVWQFANGKGDWCNSNNYYMTIYKKTDIYLQLKDLNFNSFETLEYNWQKVPTNMNNIGICFAHSKVVGLKATKLLKGVEIHFFEQLYQNKSLILPRINNIHKAIYDTMTSRFIFSLLSI